MRIAPVHVVNPHLLLLQVGGAIRASNSQITVTGGASLHDNTASHVRYNRFYHFDHGGAQIYNTVLAFISAIVPFIIFLKHFKLLENLVFRHSIHFVIR